MTSSPDSAGADASLPAFARSAARAGVALPRYRPGQAAIGVVHLGVGNFHRAHQAVVLDDALARGEPGWAISGVSLRNPGMRDALQPQGGMYSLIVRGGSRDALHAEARVIGAIRELLVAPESPAAVVDRMAAPATRWVTLTVTEKGYSLDPGSGALDHGAADIVHDLAHPHAPRSAIGLIAATLVRRFAGAGPGLAILSCDNLPDNGRKLAAAVRAFLQAAAGRAGWPDAAGTAGLLRWIDDAVVFPASMVDRIVPHTTDAVRTLARELLGAPDAWPVATEPFMQWVLEDRFQRHSRPRLEDSGVQLVSDVAPWEAMKLRLLNAAHSGLAYLGAVAGLQTVDAAIAAPPLAAFIDRYWRDEATPGLPASVRADAPGYCARLRERFANAALAHATVQIAMDGSQKLPVRVLPTLRDALADGRGIAGAATIVAAWIRFLQGRDEAGRTLPLNDPLAARLAPLADAARPRAERVRALLAVAEVFGTLGTVPAVTDAVTAALERIETRGVLAALD